MLLCRRRVRRRRSKSGRRLRRARRQRHGGGLGGEVDGELKRVGRAPLRALLEQRVLQAEAAERLEDVSQQLLRAVGERPPAPPPHVVREHAAPRDRLHLLAAADKLRLRRSYRRRRTLCGRRVGRRCGGRRRALIADPPALRGPPALLVGAPLQRRPRRVSKCLGRVSRCAHRWQPARRVPPQDWDADPCLRRRRQARQQRRLRRRRRRRV